MTAIGMRTVRGLGMHFGSLNELSIWTASGGIKAGNAIRVNGQIGNAVSNLGEIRLMDVATEATTRLHGEQGVIDALAAVSRTGQPVTLDGTVRRVGTTGNVLGIDVSGMHFPQIQTLPT